MNKFNWDLIYEPNAVVHCETKQQAIELLTEAHNNGFKWSNGSDYLGRSNYDVFENKTCYYIFGKSYDNIEYFKKQNYKILKFEECKLMNKLLDVDFIIQKDNKTIVLDIKHMDESLRKGVSDPIIESNCGIYSICSHKFPQIHKSKLYLKGIRRDLDDIFTHYTFSSTKEMNEYIENMNKLIDKINNPIMEINVNKNYEYKFSDNISLDVYNSSNYTVVSFYKYENVTKVFYIDDKEEDGQPFDEAAKEFDNFCKRRSINAKLVR